MKAFSFAGLVLALLVFPVNSQPPEMPKPVKEHEWLKMFVGEWTCEGECMMDPAKPMKCTATESVKEVGGFWIHSEMKGDMGGMAMTGMMTLGFDAAKKKFVGTWICSCDGHLWNYVGSVDSTGKILTLEAEGPDMKNPGKMAKYKDVTEFKNDKHRVMTSYVQGANGEWTKMMHIDSKKK